MSELESLKNKIKYRSSYRGTKEMDILLTTFVSKVIDLLSFDELKILNDFINCGDEEINNFYSNGISIPSFNHKKILSLFREHKI